ncbi:hypothetical protein E4U53_004991 [Claviceps sorghi]|nr:hypothetical protein E4U53_004991 [Claviceps sorghi]
MSTSHQYQNVHGVVYVAPFPQEQVDYPGDNYPSDVDEASHQPRGYPSDVDEASHQPLGYPSDVGEASHQPLGYPSDVDEASHQPLGYPSDVDEASYEPPGSPWSLVSYPDAAPLSPFESWEQWNSTPSRVGSPEQSLPTPIPVWVPDTTRIRATIKKDLLDNGIGRYLGQLEDLNFINSAQRWSEFPDDEPEDVEIPWHYRTTVTDHVDRLREGSLMKCQRCGTLCDKDYQIVEDQDGAAERVAYVLPYVHCPLGSIRQCHIRRTREFIAVERKLVLWDRLQSWRKLEQHIFTKQASKVSADVFGEERLAPAIREIFNAYRGIRVFWHRLSLMRHENPQDFSKDDGEYIDSLPVWGDLMTDVTLAQKSLISEQHIGLAYEISSRGADYLYRWQSEWTREVYWLNAYVGMFRQRYRTHGHVPLRTPIWQKAARKVGLGLEVLVDAEEKTNGTWENLQNYRQAKILVRSLFRELHSQLVHVARND